MSKFSVIVPAYNSEKTITRCINSVLLQTFADFELICVDDGSNDMTGEILDKFAQNDKRVVVIHKKNGGIASARNAGLDKATGEYLFFVDSDDWVSDYFLETVNSILVRKTIDICLFDTYRNINGVDLSKSSFDGNEGLILNKDNVLTFAKYNKNAVVWNKIINTELVKKNNIHFVDLYYLDDFIFCIQIFKYSKTLFYSKKAGYHYYDCDSSITHMHDERIVKMWKDYYEQALNNCPVTDYEGYVRYLNANIFEGLVQTYDRYYRYILGKFNFIEKYNAFKALTKAWPYCVAQSDYTKQYLSNSSKIMLIFNKPSFGLLNIAILLRKLKNIIYIMCTNRKRNSLEKNS